MIYSSLYVVNHAANYTCFVTKAANLYKVCAASFGVFIFLFILLLILQSAIQ